MTDEKCDRQCNFRMFIVANQARDIPRYSSSLQKIVDVIIFWCLGKTAKNFYKLHGLLCAYLSFRTEQLGPHWKDFHVFWYMEVKQSHYKLGQAQRFPGGCNSQISRQSAHEGGDVSSTHRPPLPPHPRKYSWYLFLLEAESTPGP